MEEDGRTRVWFDMPHAPAGLGAEGLCLCNPQHRMRYQRACVLRVAEDGWTVTSAGCLHAIAPLLSTHFCATEQSLCRRAPSTSHDRDGRRGGEGVEEEEEELEAGGRGGRKRKRGKEWGGRKRKRREEEEGDEGGRRRKRKGMKREDGGEEMGMMGDAWMCRDHAVSLVPFASSSSVYRSMLPSTRWSRWTRAAAAAAAAPAAAAAVAWCAAVAARCVGAGASAAAWA